MSVRLKEWKKNGKTGWEVDLRITLPDGSRPRERVKSPVSSKSGTMRWAQQREAEILAQGGRTPKVPKAEAPTVEAFSQEFLTFSGTNNKPSTVHAKEWMLRVHLLPYFGSTRLDQLGPAAIEAYKAKKLDEGLNRKSINNHLTALRKLLNLAVEWDRLERAPKVRGFALKTQPVNEDEFLTFEEADRLIRATSSEWRPMIAVALKTGLRVGELLALRWGDVDVVAGQIVVRRTLWHGEEGAPKGGRHRPVPLSEEAAATLKVHRHLRGPYVFCSEAGSRLTHSTVKDVVPQACLRAGLAKRITWHGLRHTFASHLVMRGASLKAVQELLGHESIEMTLRYAHLTPDVRRATVRLLDGARGDVGETASG
jgi:integrase